MPNTLFLSTVLIIEFFGPCSPKPLLQASVSGSFTTVGELTVRVLQDHQVAFQGTSHGLNSAFGSPTGMDALEIISDDEMRSYGWCYSVDEKLPEVYPDEFFLDKKVNKIRWYFGHAHYLKSQWVSQCEKTFEVVPDFLCKEKQ